MTTDNKVSEPIKRFDPIHWSDMGGWSYDSANIKEAKDGDFVRFEDHEEVVARLRQERDDLVGALREEYERLERECNEDDARERGSTWVRYYRDFQGFLMDKIHMHKPQ